MVVNSVKAFLTLAKERDRETKIGSALSPVSLRKEAISSARGPRGEVRVDELESIVEACKERTREGEVGISHAKPSLAQGER